MKFLEYLLTNQISIWRDFYVNYRLLKRILKLLHQLYESKLRIAYVKKQENPHQAPNEINESLLLSMREPDCDITKSDREFRTQILFEIEKVEHFYKDTLHKKIETRLYEIQEQIEYAKLNNIFNSYQQTFELAIKELYKEISLLKDFVDLNIKAKGKILKKYRKVIKLISKDCGELLNVDQCENDVNAFIEKSELKDYENTFNKLYNQISKIFAYGFADKYKNQTNKLLKVYNTKEQFSQWQAFYFGIAIGTIIFESIIIVCLCINYNISMDSDIPFGVLVPIFRSFLLVLIYIFFLGISIYVWNQNNFTYKILLKMPSGYSDTFYLLQRCSFFGLILFTCVLLYFFTREQIPFLHGTLSFIPSNVYPLIAWTAFLIYLLCPIPNFMDYSGRSYLFNLIKETLLFNVEFRNIWLAEQFITLIGPLRGLEYTICYYAYAHQGDLKVEGRCSYHRSHIKFFILTMIPLILRTVQCGILLYKHFSNSFIVRGHTLNLIKHSIFIFTCLFSYLSMFMYRKMILVRIWIGFMIIGALFSTYYDLKYEFGLLQVGKYFPFRSKTYFNKTEYAYGMFLTFLLRIFFFLMLSPEMLAMFDSERLQSTLFVLYICEIVRRFIWNCFRIEIKYIEAAKRYQTSNDVKLPFFIDEKGGVHLKKAFEKDQNELRRAITNKSVTNEEIVEFESRTIGDIEDKEMFDMETLYEKELNNYLKKDYYVKTKENLSGEKSIVDEVYIIDEEHIN